MEINLQRMAEYNGYNMSILAILKDEGLITAEQCRKCIDAVNLLAVTYQQIKPKTWQRGDTRIVMIDARGEFRGERVIITPPESSKA